MELSRDLEGEGEEVVVEGERENWREATWVEVTRVGEVWV
jgi:hypothetical protein